MKKLEVPLLLAALAAVSVSGQQQDNQAPSVPRASASVRLLEALEPAALREQAREALERSPLIARASHRAAAVEARAPQARALPDPVATVTWFALPPETRVGPQRFSAAVSQKLPWAGKRDLAEEAALYEAVAARAALETSRLDVLTETRRLFHELSFLSERESILHGERRTLERFEEAAQARYASGRGLQQEAVRIQAQITAVDGELLTLFQRRATLAASFNAVRDRPASTPVLGQEPSPPRPGPLDAEALRSLARDHRPEVTAADAEIARHGSLARLAEKGFKPDLTLAAGYTVVGKRTDQLGQEMPPQDNGQDIVGLSTSLNLPVWRSRLEAALQEALSRELAAQEEKRRLLSEIDGEVGDLTARLPLLYEQWELLEKVLQTQAREA